IANRRVDLHSEHPRRPQKGSAYPVDDFYAARTRITAGASLDGFLTAMHNRIFAGLAGEGPKPERIMIDATHLKAHRAAASLLKKGLFPAVSSAPSAG
ncbi:MAG: hypothetical protein J0I61_25980, partial [Bosea sp.]|nr:hypothetical protein [Bosea sp. (in: a-proteobacteria)]